MCFELAWISKLLFTHWAGKQRCICKRNGGVCTRQQEEERETKANKGDNTLRHTTMALTPASSACPFPIPIPRRRTFWRPALASLPRRGSWQPSFPCSCIGGSHSSRRRRRYGFKISCLCFFLPEGKKCGVDIVGNRPRSTLVCCVCITKCSAPSPT